MFVAQRTYRGINYNPDEHETASRSWVEHVYRGKRYQAPLKHDPAENNPNIELHYRGSVYHHRKETAQNSIKN